MWKPVPAAQQGHTKHRTNRKPRQSCTACMQADRHGLVRAAGFFLSCELDAACHCSNLNERMLLLHLVQQSAAWQGKHQCNTRYSCLSLLPALAEVGPTETRCCRSLRHCVANVGVLRLNLLCRQNSTHACVPDAQHSPCYNLSYITGPGVDLCHVQRMVTHLNDRWLDEVARGFVPRQSPS